MAFGRGDGPGLAAGLLGSMLIAFGIGIAGTMIGGGIAGAPVEDRHVTVEGLAEREVKANLAVWPLRIASTGDDLGLVQGDVDQDVRTLQGFLTSFGFDEAEISLGQLEVQDRLAKSAGAELPHGGRYLVAQPLKVRSTNVDLVAEASRKLGDVARQGVVLSGSEGPAFVYSRIGEIKQDMLQEATTSARDAAQQFADHSSAKLGGVRDASQGAFEILPRDGVPGESEASQIFKRVRVVSTVTYQLEK